MGHYLFEKMEHVMRSSIRLPTKNRKTSTIHDFMPNLEDNAANLSDFAGLCTALVSLYLELAVLYYS
jgi:fatty acid/phospholipid biosynthesis enzyme